VRIRLVLLIALALASPLTSCGGGSGGESQTTRTSTRAGTSSSRGATGSSTRREKPGFEEAQAKHPELPALSGGSGFDRSMVRVSFINTSNPFGAKSAVVYFVTAASAKEALSQAKGCVRAYLSKAPSAYCFAFGSERAFRFAQVRRRPPADMKRACWTAYWGRSSGRRPIGSAHNPALGALHCPGG
jgi:hypothetical protein